MYLLQFLTTNVSCVYITQLEVYIFKRRQSRKQIRKMTTCCFSLINISHLLSAREQQQGKQVFGKNFFPAVTASSILVYSIPISKY